MESCWILIFINLNKNFLWNKNKKNYFLFSLADETLTVKMFSTTFNPKNRITYIPKDLSEFIPYEKKKLILYNNDIAPSKERISNINFKNFKLKFLSTGSLLAPLDCNIQLQENFNLNQNTIIYLLKLFLYFSKSYKIFWHNLLITISDIKMRGMLEHYDYFGLYATARNFICVHSELQLNKTIVKLTNLPLKTNKINFYFAKLAAAFIIWKNWVVNLKKISNFNFIPKENLEKEIFKNFFSQFSGTKFEKTNPLQRSLFLDKYLIYRKLLPNSWKDFLGYISPTTRAENFLYAYPYHTSSIFFWNLFNFFVNKKKRIIDINFFKNKIFFKNFLFMHANMSMLKLPTNRFTKRTDAHFQRPHKWVKIFLNKIFENKKNWFLTKDNHFTTLNFQTNAKNLWIIYATNWSSGKRYFWKCLEHETYFNLDYFTKAKYVRKDFIVESFSPTIWKDFSAYAEKFTYNSLNFNYKRLLWVLFPKQKLIEYNLLGSNNINNFLGIEKKSRSFFSINWIFKRVTKQDTPSCNLSTTSFYQNTNFDADDYKNKLTDLLHDLYYNQSFYSPSYEQPYDYYKENFYDKKIVKPAEHYFSKNLILSATILKFPILLNSRIFREKFYILLKRKSDFTNMKSMQNYLQHVNNFTETLGSNLYKKYLDQFIFLNRVISGVVKLSSEKLIVNNINNVRIISILDVLIKKMFNFNIDSITKIQLLLFIFHLINVTELLLLTKKTKLLEKNILIQDIFAKFFWFAYANNQLFRLNKFSLRFYFTQSIKSKKWNPITFFRIIGIKKTKSKGCLTIIAFNFNIFLPSVFFTLTLNRSNPNFLPFDSKQLQTFIIDWNIDYTFLKYLTTNENFSIFYDNILLKIFYFNDVFKFKQITPYFINNLKLFLFKIFPKNILNKNNFKFWFNHIITFENFSINVLTSKMWRNTLLKTYFFGAINVLLFSKNNYLLKKITLNEINYIKIINSLSVLEAQALSFHDILLPFQIDFKKFELSWKSRLVKSIFKENYFFFLKNFFTKNFYQKNSNFETNLLLNFISNLALDRIWLINFDNFYKSPTTNIINSKKLFPVFLMNDSIKKFFNFWWYFFGFSKSLYNTSLVSIPYNKFLIFIFFIARIYVNTKISEIFFMRENKNIFHFINNPMMVLFFKKNVFLYKNPIVTEDFLKKKFQYYNSSINRNFLVVDNYQQNLKKNYNSTNYNTIISPLNTSLAFCPTEIYPFQPKNSILKAFLLNVFDIKLKKIFNFNFVKIDKFWTSRENFYFSLEVQNFFKAKFFLNTSKIKNNFDLLFLINWLNLAIFSSYNLYMLKKNFIFGLLKNYFNVWIKIILLLIRLILIIFLNLNITKKLLIIFLWYFKFKKIIKTTDNWSSETLNSYLKFNSIFKIKLPGLVHQTFFLENFTEDVLADGLLHLSNTKIIKFYKTIIHGKNYCLINLFTLSCNFLNFILNTKFIMSIRLDEKIFNIFKLKILNIEFLLNYHHILLFHKFFKTKTSICFLNIANSFFFKNSKQEFCKLFNKLNLLKSLQKIFQNFFLSAIVSSKRLLLQNYTGFFNVFLEKNIKKSSIIFLSTNLTRIIKNFSKPTKTMVYPSLFLIKTNQNQKIYKFLIYNTFKNLKYLNKSKNQKFVNFFKLQNKIFSNNKSMVKLLINSNLNKSLSKIFFISENLKIQKVKNLILNFINFFLIKKKLIKNFLFKGDIFLIQFLILENQISKNSKIFFNLWNIIHKDMLKFLFILIHNPTKNANTLSLISNILLFFKTNSFKKYIKYLKLNFNSSLRRKQNSITIFWDFIKIFILIPRFFFFLI